MRKNDRLLHVLEGRPTEVTPVWIMRQAGRYLRDYRDLRERYSFLELCTEPERIAEVTLLPLRELDVDGLIIFSDILLLLLALGVDVAFKEKEGPVILNPIRTGEDIARLKAFEPEEKKLPVLTAIRMLSGRSLPLIGFSGAPFTLASYAVEGGHSRHFLAIKTLLYQHRPLFEILMEKLTKAVTGLLEAQVAAGVDAVQLFDTWAGVLAYDDYVTFVEPYSRQIVRALEKKVPVIHFVLDSAHLLPSLALMGSRAIGIDWRIPVDRARAIVGDGVALQGNLDPAALFAPHEVIEGKVREILSKASGKGGHIFNLGHGILPQTPLENVKCMIEAVHTFSRSPDQP
ncbi:MAG: uroporphyrinogen decarboxylase [Candidatus Eremiobacteraeota bacterium]|nr:uroporphyrinogen decarboxylase [Candidatus Eremiobacteraeota bacterium]